MMIWPPGVFLFYHFQKMKAKPSKQEVFQQDAESSTESTIKIVKFHQTKIQCIIDSDGTIQVALKPIMDSIGLHADSAWKSIKNDPILGAKHAVRRGLDAKNREFPMQTLPIEFVHGWLFSIDASKVSATARPKLIEFKKECYQVLFDHFYGKFKVYENNLAQKSVLHNRMKNIISQRNELARELTSLKKQLQEIESNELSGQLQLNVGGNK